MPRYLNATEPVGGGKSGKKGKSKRNRSNEINNNGRPKSAPDGRSNDGGGAGNLDLESNLSEINSESGRLSISDTLDDDVASVVAESVFGAGGEISDDQWAQLESKLVEHIDNATHKNTNIRVPALKGVEKILTSHYLPDFLENRKVTLADVSERLLKKGSAMDGRFAAKIASCLALQIGSSASDAIQGIVQLLKPKINDAALSELYRAECATTIGICTFIAEEESENIVNVLECLHQAWSHVKVHAATPESVPFFSAAASAWAFVLLQAPTKNLEHALNNDLTKLSGFLESNQLDIRISAGETLAVLYELASHIYSDFRPPHHQHVLDQLERMSTESTKHFAKKDRRQQRSSFREIYAAVKSNDTPSFTVKFAPEVLVIDSWSSKLCYDIFCQVLSGGMNIHLKENSIIRDVFNLGPPLPSGSTFKRLSKTERLAISNTVSKARTLLRGKQRDKRTAVF